MPKDPSGFTTQIGWLTPAGDGAIGTCCANLLTQETKGKLSPLFKVNVHPYRQDCILCGGTIHEGNPTWPILFERKNPKP